jgi:hypothetical protein
VNLWESLAVGVLISLLTAEFSELGPWLAPRVIQLSARLLMDRHLAQQYHEEWLAGIEGTPGKLTPLVRAAGIMFIAMPVLNYRYFDDWWVCTIGLRSLTWNLRLQLRMPRRVTWVAPGMRSERIRYNHVVDQTCQALRSGPADQKAEALEVLQLLLEDPPPWTIRRIAKSILRKELPMFRRALTARGYLPRPS